MIGLYKKAMVLIILVLFFGAGVMPVISGNIGEHMGIETFISTIPYDDGSVVLPSADRADKDWDVTTNPPHMYSIPGGNVGIGVYNPLVKLHVRSAKSYAIAAEGGGFGAICGIGIGFSSGVAGYSDKGVGVQGYSEGGVGVMGDVISGTAIFGRCIDGHAGHFQGDVVVLGGNIGIEENQPLAKLHAVSPDTEKEDYAILGQGEGYSNGVYGISEKSVGVGGISEDGIGVYGFSDNDVAVIGHSNFGYAGQFFGPVNILGSLDIDGGLTMPIAEVEGYYYVDSSDYTITATTYYELTRIFLPYSDEDVGRILNIKCHRDKAPVFITPFPGEFIDYESELILTRYMECVTLQSYDGGWWIINHYLPPL
jgi:hypothetical protein